MPNSITFQGAGFNVASAAHQGGVVVRVSFTQDPKLISSGASNDGLNPANYVISGPIVLSIIAVNSVINNTSAVDLTCSAPLPSGSYVVSVAGVVSSALAALTAPTQASFSSVSTAETSSISGGAVNFSSIDIIRRHFNSELAGPAWDSVIAALAAGDDINRENAQKAFDQLFLSTASGKYVEQRASDVGIQKPIGVGMSDDTFRKYAIAISSDKLTELAILKVLEVFYGSSSVRAHLENTVAETYVLVDGYELSVLLDGRINFTIVFSSQDFNLIGQASALEVAAAITKAFSTAKLDAYAEVYVNPTTNTKFVSIFSGALGLSSKVAVVGGRAQDILKFPTPLTPLITI